MYNSNIIVKPNDTMIDIIEMICQSESIWVDDFFAFSAIMTRDKIDPTLRCLKINCLEEKSDNPHTPETLVVSLFEKPEKKGCRFVMPPLEQYLSVFKPNLLSMVNGAYTVYNRLIPEKEELMCILNLVIVQLYNAGYYLHKKLIRKAFTNQLNKDIRKTKLFGEMISLDAECGKGEDGSSLTLLDKLICPTSTDNAYAQSHYTDTDIREDKFNQIKAAMLRDMSELQFDRIMIQLKSKTLDSSNCKKLEKYRRKFNPGFSLRPNRGKV